MRKILVFLVAAWLAYCPLIDLAEAAASWSKTAAQASATNTATSTTTGSWINLTAKYEARLSGLITNGGTGPTVPCTMFVDLSPDNGTTIYSGAGGQFTAGVTASTSYYGAFPDFAGWYVRTRFTGNTGQSVTVQADIMTLDGL